ncbi:unnamed protein product [Spirodela intermedia]|uniref:Uncharacterized protein n=1 Tax=Spirodela intermedia TaxID=51605 RepID=A0A7I8IK25_SPIIN|nr:unnamed protein product [Spirodela intermedia]CAA6658240.1 unnamed protein product [Spirodela intermedia]
MGSLLVLDSASHLLQLLISHFDLLSFLFPSFSPAFNLSFFFLFLKLRLEYMGDDNIFPAIGCLPCSQRYLLSSLSEGNQTKCSAEIKTLISQEFGSHDSCKRVPHSKSTTPVLSAMQRHLNGDGSHRRLVSSMRFEFLQDSIPELDAYYCKVVLIESLPAGVFADSFELDRLVHNGVFLDAAIFGDTNLELPSTLSNRSTLELHLDGGHTNMLELQIFHISSELPLHARYPPLDARGYSKVEIGTPNVAMVCKPKHLLQDCSSLIYSWSMRSEQKVIWDVPCGNQAFSGIVSGVTFASALLSALIIAYVSIIHSLSRKQIKQS